MATAPVAGVLAFLATWQLVLQFFGSSGSVLPTPSVVIAHIASDPTYYWINGIQTAQAASIGFVIALLAGSVGGFFLARWPLLERMTQPLIVLIQVTPIIAYAGAVVIWLGYGLNAILFLVVIVCIVPIILNTVVGLRSVKPELLELAHSVDASRWDVYWHMQLPTAVPYLFSAARIAVGLALIGTVLGELFSKGRAGLGYSIILAIDHQLVLQLWGSIFVLAAIGSLGMAIITLAERLLSRWTSSRIN